MPKIKIGRKRVYLEVFEIDTNKLSSIRDDLDLCERMLWASDPVLTQQIISFTEEGKSAIKFLYRLQCHVSKNPVYPVPNHQEGLDECPRYDKPPLTHQDNDQTADETEQTDDQAKD